MPILWKNHGTNVYKFRKPYGLTKTNWTKNVPADTKDAILW